MSPSKHKAELLARLEPEARAWGRHSILLQVDLATFTGLCASVQLALRHPGFKNRRTARRLEKTLVGWIDRLPPALAATKELCSLGFNPAYDEPSCAPSPDATATSGENNPQSKRAGPLSPADPSETLNGL